MSPIESLQLEFVPSIRSVEPTTWDALFPPDHPFTRHAFLTALENSGCTTEASGWAPHHLIARQYHTIVAILPCYRKTHSYGEYVFDWAWANAYRRYGLSYYPKLVTAIPFTPATGPRLGLRPDWQTVAHREAILSAMHRHVQQALDAQNGSSWHLYFPTSDLSQSLQKLGCSQRLGVQYHWFNADYRDFDDFLSRFASRKRKNVRRERRRIQEQGLRLIRLTGADIKSEHMQSFYQFYHLTYLKRSGGRGYLNRAFFDLMLKHFAPQLMMVLAYHDEELVAAALNFQDQTTLYGRYWGCEREYEFLHFEACYYQGIEHCIEQGLQRFDPGAQGEHKIQRGFEPVPTWSNHWIRDAAFRDAINAFIDQERQHMEAYIREAKLGLPFRQTSD